MTNANPYDLPDPSAGQTPGQAPGQPQGGQVAPNYSLSPGISNAFVNAFYPGWGIQNGQLSAQNASAQNIMDTPGAANRLNSLWDPYSQGNYQQFFDAYRGDAPANPQSLASLLQPLSGLGWKGNANASGQITDFTLPNGQVIDPLYAAGDPSQTKWQWSTGGGGGTLGSLTAPFNEPFTPPQGPNLGGPKGLEYLPPLPQFKQPTLADMNIDPGYQFRTQQGEQALEQSAAGRGVLNTGGTLKDILNYGQSAASQEYGNIWNRNLQAYQAGLQGWNAIAPVAQRENELDYSRAYDKWLQDYTIDRNQKNDTFTKQFQTTTA